MRAASVLLILLAGCATANLPRGQIAVDNYPVSVDKPCVPPRMPPFAEWRAVGAEPVIVTDAIGRPVLGVSVGYAVRDAPVKGWWFGGALAIVDPDPRDADTPLWYDKGLMDDKDKLRAGGAPFCDWRRGGGQTVRLEGAPRLY